MLGTGAFKYFKLEILISRFLRGLSKQILLACTFGHFVINFLCLDMWARVERATVIICDMC